MSKELVIGSNRHETKVAILEEDQLAEIYFQRGNEYSLAGSIHKGRVTRVLPGMQSAFVDLGLERDTFLYVSDFFEEHEDIDTVTDEKPTRGDRRDRGQPRPIDRGPIVVQPAEAAPVSAEQPVVPVRQALLREEGSIGGAIAAAPAVSRELPDQRQREQRAEGDRGFQGDRRGRRSRRRRSKGRGFPENKYAQPGSAEPAQHEARTPVSDTVEVEEESDVIMLPGESLAKYRNVAAVGGDEKSVPGEDDLDEVIERDEELDEEAQELESTDRILSHHIDEGIIEEEDKLQEVKEDQPSSPFFIEDIDDEEEAEEKETPDSGDDEPRRVASAEVRSSSPVQALQTSTLYSFDEQVVPVSEPTLSVREHVDQPLEHVRASTPVDEESSEREDAEPMPFEADDTLTGESLEAGEFDGADLEDLPAGFEGSEPETPVTNPEASFASAPSTEVREQGNRFQNRGSRRMRRRRGGNRPFSQTGESVTESSGGPAAAAAATASRSEPSAEARAEFEEERSTERPERVMPSITELLKPGQEIIVQIAKEPLGQKGARITSHVALPGRYVVFMPSVGHLGVSRKIESDEERQRLKRILQAHRVGTSGGFIVRTAGAGIPEEEIAADMEFLYKLWLDIRQKAEKRPAPALLHYDLDIVQRILRDQVTEDYKAIWVDSEEMYENVLSFTQRFQPALVNRVKMYTRSAPIFDAFGITQELEKALRPKVWLKSGGYIVINQTEALVAIDINTGKYVGKSNRLEDTIVKTNTEAVKEIVRQIRLRDLGGIIVVDFIDMDERKNRQKVMQTLEEAMQADRAPYKILQFNDFGLVAITRKRVKQSLERTLCAPCPYCEGAGYVKSVQTIIGEILIEAQKIAKAIEGKDVMLRVHTDVAKVLKGSDNHYLEELEEILGRPVLVKGDPALHHEKFDLG